MASNPDSKNTSFKTQQFEISFATSNKGKPLVIYENCLFRCNKKAAERCVWYQNVVCPYTRARRVDPDPIGSGSGSINFRYDEL